MEPCSMCEGDEDVQACTNCGTLMCRPCVHEHWDKCDCGTDEDVAFPRG